MRQLRDKKHREDIEEQNCIREHHGGVRASERYSFTFS